MVVLDWNNYHSLIDELSEIIKDSKIKYSYIYGIPDDGLLIATHISHKLNIKLIPEYDALLTLQDQDDEILLVDNIINTGNTFMTIKKKFRESDTASLFMNPNSCYIPTYHVHCPDKKIVFPWEKVESVNQERSLV